MSDSAPNVDIKPNRKKPKLLEFQFPEELIKALEQNDITIAKSKSNKQAVHFKEKRGLEILFRDKSGGHLSLDQVMDKLSPDLEKSNPARSKLRGNLVHGLLHHYQEEAITDNGCVSACFIETYASNDTKKKHPRYFVATNIERVNPEAYAGRGCAETTANTLARVAYKDHDNPHGDYVLDELHLRCYFIDTDNQQIKFEHGNLCLCGVCRDVCDGLWTENAEVWLHPINAENTFLNIETGKDHTSYSKQDISILKAHQLLPEKRIEISNQKQARKAFSGFRTVMQNLTHGNESLERSKRLEMEKATLEKQMELQQMLLAAPEDQCYEIDPLTLQGGEFLQGINEMMVKRLKEEIYTHLLSDHAAPSNWQDALPDKIEIVAGINPKTGKVALAARREGEKPSSTPVVTAHLAEQNNNVRGMSELFYMKFDKAEFLALSESENLEIHNHFPAGNERERGVKQQTGASQQQDRELVRSNRSGEYAQRIEKAQTRQRWTTFPLNNGMLTAHELREIMHQSTAEQLLGSWKGVKLSNSDSEHQR